MTQISRHDVDLRFEFLLMIVIGMFPIFDRNQTQYQRDFPDPNNNATSGFRKILGLVFGDTGEPRIFMKHRPAIRFQIDVTTFQISPTERNRITELEKVLGPAADLTSVFPWPGCRQRWHFTHFSGAELSALGRPRQRFTPRRVSRYSTAG